MAVPASLLVEGAIRRPMRFDADALAALDGQVPDVGTLKRGRRGRAVRLASLLAQVEVAPEATHLTVVSSDGDFSASVPSNASSRFR